MYINNEILEKWEDRLFMEEFNKIYRIGYKDGYDAGHTDALYFKDRHKNHV